MDRHRRESKDTGSSRDHRRSRSPLQPRNSEGGYRSRRSRSSDKNKSSKDSGDASRKRSDDDIRHKESSKDKYDDARGRNYDYNEKRKFSESNRSRGRDGEASSGGKSSSSHNREDDRERDKAFMKKDTANREDAVVIRNSSCSSSSSFKRSRRSSSPPSSTIRDVVGEKSQIVRETSKRSTRPTESSRDPGRTGDDSDNLQSESQKGSHTDDHSSTACIESDIKTSEVRDVDDHGREVRSRRESSISKASRYGDDYSRRDDSSRGRTDTGRAEGHRRSDTREGGTREKTDRHRSTHKDFSPERGERRLRDAVEGTSRKDQGPLRHQYGPGGQDNDFSTGSGQGGNGNGNGGSREVPGPHGGGVDMWGTGKGTNMSEGGFGQNGGMAPFAGWEGQGSQQGGGGGRERAPTSESFRDDWHRGHQHHSNFPAGPNGFMGGQTGGRFDQFALQPSSEFDKRQWGWDQQQQQQVAQ